MSRKMGIVGVVGLIVVALAFIVGRWSGGAALNGQPKQEHVTLQIGLNSGGACVLRERTPPEIRTESNAGVTWTIAGNCGSDHTIAVAERDLAEVFERGRLRGNAVAGEVLTAILKSNLQKKEYTYQVLIDDQPAQYASPADRGTFLACPEWPCGGFAR